VLVLGSMHADAVLASSCGLPLTSDSARNRSPRRIPETTVTNTVLVVEDDADTRLGLRVLLRAHDYEPVFAANAADAITQAIEHDPDLILLDLGLPGIDGFELLEYFGHKYVSMVPVIVLSGRERHKNKERALHAGAVNYLQKPWNDDELLELIDRYSARPPYAA
jgi:DNA-binding response OmpR family regulator